jgi:hypothetical protein
LHNFGRLVWRRGGQFFWRQRQWICSGGEFLGGGGSDSAAAAMILWQRQWIHGGASFLSKAAAATTM